MGHFRGEGQSDPDTCDHFGLCRFIFVTHIFFWFRLTLSPWPGRPPYRQQMLISLSLTRGQQLPTSWVISSIHCQSSHHTTHQSSASSHLIHTRFGMGSPFFSNVEQSDDDETRSDFVKLKNVRRPVEYFLIGHASRFTAPANGQCKYVTRIYMCTLFSFLTWL